MKRAISPGGLALTLLIPLALALATVRFKRLGPERVAYGNLCGQGMLEPCAQPVLKSGLPFAFLFDTPRLSVENQLDCGEDEFVPGFLLADVWVWRCLLLVALRLAERMQIRIRRR